MLRSVAPRFAQLVVVLIRSSAYFPSAAASGQGFTTFDGRSRSESATSGTADTDRLPENPPRWSVAQEGSPWARNELVAISTASGADAHSAAAMDLAHAAQSVSSSPVVRGASSRVGALSTSEKLDLNAMD